MVRLVSALALLGVVGTLVVRQAGQAPFAVERDGRTVSVRAEHMESRYSLAGSVSGSYMVFGTHDEPSSIESAFFLAVEAGAARYLVNEYPDLRRCGSAGAEHFKRIAEQLYMVAADGRTHRTLQQAAALYEARVADGGERFCLRIDGDRLDLEFAGLPGRELTAEFERIRRDASVLLIETAEIHDCSE